ncbi:MAG: hypothetical protein PHS32_07080 [Rhodoferax sp.]|uniref:hypothetical protein n=1 Tax=Rhodoferax sp. TaxID=50421 RepID=UPI002620528B|nr:hypothetical protein [Rhodoferax sp.]MDD5333493.1 hypothetical protein [Rhodoferax sp.]
MKPLLSPAGALRLGLALFLTAILAACGGGGGGNSAAATPDQAAAAPKTPVMRCAP